MDIVKPEVTKQHYTFKETVTGGYLNRGSWASYDIETVWTKTQTLISLKIERDDYTPFLKDGKLPKQIDLEHKYWFHYFRARNAITRHFKYLKIYLGEEKVPEKPVGRFIVQEYYEHTISDEECELTKTGKPKTMSHHALYVKSTPTTIALMKEYNQKKEAWKKEEHRLRKALFGE